MAEYDLYCSNLRRLINHSLELTENNLFPLTPHISKDKFDEILNSDKVYIALPAIKVAHTFNVICIGNKKISFQGTHRVADEKQISLHAFVSVKCDQILFAKEAIEFSKTKWGDRLIIDNWSSDALVVYTFCDTNQIPNYHTGGCKFVKNIYAIYKRGLYTAIKNNSRDLDLALITDDLLISHELASNKSIWNFYICSNCYGGLSNDHCIVCKKKFPSDLVIDQRRPILSLHPTFVEEYKKLYNK